MGEAARTEGTRARAEMGVVLVPRAGVSAGCRAESVVVGVRGREVAPMAGEITAKASWGGYLKPTEVIG